MRAPLLLLSSFAFLCAACAPSAEPPAPDDEPGEILPPEDPGTGGNPDPDPAPEPPVRGGGDWAQYRADVSGTWHVPGEVTADDARAATLDWVAELGEYGWTQPVIAGDLVVATTGHSGKVVALDASDGSERWTRELNHVFEVGCDPDPRHHGFYAAAAIHEDLVLAASPDGHLYALDAADGETRWSVQVADPLADGEFVQSSPAVSTKLGKVFLGVGASFKCAPVKSRALSVDLSTRELQTRPLTPEGFTGSSVWSSLSVDEAADVVHVTTGDPAGQPYEDLPLAQAFVGLDAEGLELKGHWQNQNPPPDSNSDFGASPTLFADNSGRPLVGAAGKDGWLYVLDRSDLAAGPVWSYELAVSGDPMMGESSLVAPTFANGTLYAAGGRTPAGEEGQVVALNPADGSVRWRHLPPGFVMAGMPAVGDILIVASNKAQWAGSTLELLDLDSGEVLKTFESDSPTLGAPSVGRGRILWYRYDGSLQAIRLPVD